MPDLEGGTVLVTGGCGFIGSALVRHLLERTGLKVAVIDSLTYASVPEATADLAGDERYAFEQVDVCDRPALDAAFARHRPSAVMHLAAESHVDRSIDGPDTFIRTNLHGTFALLEASRAWLERADAGIREGFRYHQISTDEVFGSLSPEMAPLAEGAAYDPRSPYSASKAGADHLVRAWGTTYGLPVIVSNCSNNFGPWQFPEKLIPLMIARAVDGLDLPVYGTGENIRDWLHVSDHASALHLILTRGTPGETYNVSAHAERRNIDLVRDICALMDARCPRNDPHERLIRFVADRPGHDQRYALDAGRLMRELGWIPARGLKDGLGETVEWYLANEDWWRGILARGTGAGARLGLKGGGDVAGQSQ